MLGSVALLWKTQTSTAGCAAAVERIHTALESFERNPNERLLLESLLWSLPNASSTR